MDTPSPKGPKLVRTPISERSYFPSGSLSSSFITNPDETNASEVRPQRLFWGTMEARPEYEHSYRWPSRESFGDSAGSQPETDQEEHRIDQILTDKTGPQAAMDPQPDEAADSTGAGPEHQAPLDNSQLAGDSVIHHDVERVSPDGSGPVSDSLQDDALQPGFTHDSEVTHASDTAVQSRVPSASLAASPIQSPAHAARSSTPTIASPTPCRRNPALDSEYSPIGSLNSPTGSLTSPLHSNSSSGDFQNSSFLDDTRAQFDLDINIDNFRRTNHFPRKQSPWRDFRRGTHFLNTRNISETSAATSSARVDDLTKQLTNCKIQLRLYEKFLQDLIDRHLISDNQLAQFGSDGQSLGGLGEKFRDSAPETASKQGPDKPEDSETSALMEDLYSSLEEYQARWRAADQDASALRQTVSKFAEEVAKMLDAAGISTTEKDPSSFLTEAMPLLRQYTQPWKPARQESQEEPADSDTLLKSPETNMKLGQTDLESKLLENNQMIEALQREVRELRQNQSRLPSQSSINRSSMNHSGTNMGLNHSAFHHSSMASADYSQASLSDVSDYFRSHDKLADRDRLDISLESRLENSLESRLENKLESKLEDRLERERERERSSLRKNYDSLQNSYTQLEAANSRLISEHNQLISEHNKLISEHQSQRKETEKSLAALTARLDRQNRDETSARANAAQITSLQNDLDASVEKQRVLATEKIRLAYQLEAMEQNKTDLQKTVDSLNAKLSTAQKSASGEKALDDAVRQFDRFFEVDIRSFEKLLSSFNKIADEASLQKPRKNTRFLATLKKCRLLEQPPDSIFAAREAHRSVSDYFGRAVDVVVNDHIRLLLRENDSKSQNEQLVAEYGRKIADLEARLQKAPDARDSPRSKLRIDELTNRWKAEREARISDNRQAKKRLMELEQEKN